MIPDFDIRYYYNKYINDAKYDIEEYKHHLEVLNINRTELYDYITENKDIIKEEFNIDLDSFKEYQDNKWNKKDLLYQKIIKFKAYNGEYRIVCIQLIKYCNVLRQIYINERNIYLAGKRIDLSFREYQSYVSKYYNKVHEFVLKGFGYTYGYGIGTFIISRWKLPNPVTKLDYNATRIKKKELLDKGYQLYDDKLATWYKVRGIPYNAVDYRVYKTDKYIYDIGFINPDPHVIAKSVIEFDRNEYINKAYRGKSHKEIADEFITKEKDIYNLKTDIKYKLNVLLYLYPNRYVNFIRNAEQIKYKY